MLFLLAPDLLILCKVPLLMLTLDIGSSADASACEMSFGGGTAPAIGTVTARQLQVMRLRWEEEHRMQVRSRSVRHVFMCLALQSLLRHICHANHTSCFLNSE